MINRVRKERTAIGHSGYLYPGARRPGDIHRIINSRRAVKVGRRILEIPLDAAVCLGQGFEKQQRLIGRRQGPNPSIITGFQVLINLLSGHFEHHQGVRERIQPLDIVLVDGARRDDPIYG